jgi:Flp pilus assembly pilin Flp
MRSMKFIRGFVAEETGQALTEYALLIGFILVATVGVAAGYRQSVAGVTNAVSSNLVAAATSANSGPCSAESNCAPNRPGAVSTTIWSRTK